MTGGKLNRLLFVEIPPQRHDTCAYTRNDPDGAETEDKEPSEIGERGEHEHLQLSRGTSDRITVKSFTDKVAYDRREKTDDNALDKERRNNKGLCPASISQDI